MLTVDIRPRAEGYLKRLLFAEGQVVHKGQPLFEIDPHPYEISLEGAEAQLARAQSNVAEAQAQLQKSEQDAARYAPLATIRAIPQETYIDAVSAQKEREASLQQARASERIARVSVSEAQLNLSYTLIRAPIDGIIGWRKVDPGNLVGPQTAVPLATISSSKPIRVDFFIDDADYLRYIAPRLQALHPHGEEDPLWKLVLADGSTYPHAGRFYALGRTVNPETDTVEMQLLFDNPDDVLRPGQYAQVRANLETRKGVLLVPVDAVQTLQGNKTVYLLDHGAAKLQSIQATERSGNSWIVTDGVKPGDKLIVEGEQKLNPGEKVNAQPQSQAHGQDNSGSDVSGAGSPS